MSDLNIQFVTQAGGKLTGNIRVPGDKSMSHRSIMLSSLSDGRCHITGFLEGEDSLCTLKAFQQMGVQIEGPDNGSVVVHGVGIDGLKAPSAAIDVGNSGTAMRLMAGLLAGQKFDSTLVGDASLSGRPMKRVTNPLIAMGAKIDSTEKGTSPLHIHGNQTLQGIDYLMPIASAQVKSCVLLAGLYAQGSTCTTEPAESALTTEWGNTRDHTERMLRGFGYEVHSQGVKACLQGGGRLQAVDVDVPSDISSAAFFMVGACIAPGSDILLQHVGVNPTRTGVIDILKLMGANIDISNEREVGGEPVADIRVRSADLKGIDIPRHLVPLAIDEFPAIFVAAACAQGRTVLTGAEELRVKESDRIQVMADGLVAVGIQAEATPDGIIIEGGAIIGGTVDSHGDHRIAMAFSMAALRSSAEIRANDCKNVDTSFPDFVGISGSAGLDIEMRQ